MSVLEPPTRSASVGHRRQTTRHPRPFPSSRRSSLVGGVTTSALTVREGRAPCRPAAGAIPDIETAVMPLVSGGGHEMPQAGAQWNIGSH